MVPEGLALSLKRQVLQRAVELAVIIPAAVKVSVLFTDPQTAAQVCSVAVTVMEIILRAQIVAAITITSLHRQVAVAAVLVPLERTLQVHLLPETVGPDIQLA